MDYLLLLTSYLISVLKNRFKSLKDIKFKNALIIKIDHLGDMLSALPAIKSLKNKFPDINIDILCNGKVKDALIHNSYFNKIHVYNSKKLGYKNDIELNQLNELQTKKYDLIVSLRDDWKTIFFTFRKLRGYRTDRGTIRLINKINKIRGIEGQLTELETNRRIFGKIGVNEISRNCLVELSDNEINNVHSQFQKLEISEDEKIVCIQPGSRLSFRAWQVSNYATLADQLIDEFNLRILIIGDEFEKDTCEKMKSMMKNNTDILISKSLREYISILCMIDIYIGNDGAGVHLSSAFNKPAAIILAAADPVKFGPWSEKSLVFYDKVDCFPCHKGFCYKEKVECIEDIKWENIFDKVKEELF